MKEKLGVISVPLQGVVLNPKEMGMILDLLKLRIISTRVGEGFVFYMGISPFFQSIEATPETQIPPYDLMIRRNEEDELDVKVSKAVKPVKASKEDLDTVKETTDNIFKEIQKNISKG